MSVLKAGAAEGVRTLSSPAAPHPPSAEPSVDPRIASLTAQLARSEASFATYRGQAEAQIIEAHEVGARETRQDEDRRVAKIEHGVTAAVAAWRERLDGLERLAAMLAEAALDKLFDDHTDLGDLVARTLARRVRAIDAGAVVRVRVSARDFDDDDNLNALAARVGLPPQAIVAESDAPTGACEIDLAVGKLDLTISDQWRAIEGCLAAIARAEPA